MASKLKRPKMDKEHVLIISGFSLGVCFASGVFLFVEQLYLLISLPLIGIAIAWLLIWANLAEEDGSEDSCHV